MTSRADRLETFRQRRRKLAAKKRNVEQNEPSTIQNQAKSPTNPRLSHSKLQRIRNTKQKETSNVNNVAKVSLKERAGTFRRQHSPLLSSSSHNVSKQNSPQFPAMVQSDRNLFTKPELMKENFSSPQQIKNGVVIPKIIPKVTASDIIPSGFTNDRKYRSLRIAERYQRGSGANKEIAQDNIYSSVANGKNHNSRRTPANDSSTDKEVSLDVTLSSVSHSRKHLTQWGPTKISSALAADTGKVRDQIISSVINDRRNGLWGIPTKRVLSTDKGGRDKIITSVTNVKDGISKTPTKNLRPVADIEPGRDQILPNKAEDKSPNEALLNNDIDCNESNFSFANLQSMWSRRDTLSIQIKPPTATVPLHYETSSTECNRKPNHKHTSYLPRKKSIHTAKADNIGNCTYNDEVNNVLFKTDAKRLNGAGNSSNLSDGNGVCNLDLAAGEVTDIQHMNEKEVDVSLNDFKFCPSRETQTIEDPYINFDSMSTAYSEATVQVENTSSRENQSFHPSDASIGNSVISNDLHNRISRDVASERNKQRKDPFDYTITRVELDSDVESENNIPDSAFRLDKGDSDTANTKVSNVMEDNPSRSTVTLNSKHSFDNKNNQSEEDSTIPDSAFDMYKGHELTASALSRKLSSDLKQPHIETSVAGSDVFDGLSEIASSINSPLGKGAGSRSSPFGKDRARETLTMRSKNISDNGNTNTIEDSNYVQKDPFSEFKTISRFQKSVPNPDEDKHCDLSMRQENIAINSGRGIIQGESINDHVITARRSLEDKKKARSKSPEDIDDQSINRSQTYGISPIQNLSDKNDSITLNQQELSVHLQLLTVEIPQKSTVDVCGEEGKSEVHFFDSSNRDSDTASTYSNSSVKYPSVKEGIPDSLSSVRWVPSMIRLYGKKIANVSNLENQIEKETNLFNKERFKESTRNRDEFDSKLALPVVNGSKSFKLSNSKLSFCDSRYELTGIETLHLYKSDTFGGTIKDPSLLVCNALENDFNLPSQKPTYNQANGIKQRLLHLRRKNRTISEKAMEIHGSALAYLEIKDIEAATELYEDFLGEIKDFQLVDNQMKTRVFGAFLHNIGVLHTMVGDFEFSINFLRQATSYRQVHGEKNAVTLNEMGIAHFASGQYEDALKVFADVLSIWQNIESDERYEMTKVLNNIGCTYFVLNEIDAALEAMSEALEIQRSFLIKNIVKKINYSDEVFTSVKISLLSVSETMCNMAHVFFSTKSLEEVRYLLDKSMLIQKALFKGRCRKDLERILSSMSSSGV